MEGKETLRMCSGLASELASELLVYAFRFGGPKLAILSPVETTSFAYSGENCRCYNGAADLTPRKY